MVDIVSLNQVPVLQDQVLKDWIQTTLVYELLIHHIDEISSYAGSEE